MNNISLAVGVAIIIILSIGWTLLLAIKLHFKSTHLKIEVKELKQDVDELSDNLALKRVEAKTWIDTLTITEEASKPSKPDGQWTIFYIREKPFKVGYSYQSTAMTEAAAEWVITQLKKDYNL